MYVHHVEIEKSKERTRSVLCWSQMKNNIEDSVKPCYFAKDIGQTKQKYSSRGKKQKSSPRTKQAELIT